MGHPYATCQLVGATRACAIACQHDRTTSVKSVLTCVQIFHTSALGLPGGTALPLGKRLKAAWTSRGFHLFSHRGHILRIPPCVFAAMSRCATRAPLPRVAVRLVRIFLHSHLRGCTSPSPSCPKHVAVQPPSRPSFCSACLHSYFVGLEMLGTFYLRLLLPLQVQAISRAVFHTVAQLPTSLAPCNCSASRCLHACLA